MNSLRAGSVIHFYMPSPISLKYKVLRNIFWIASYHVWFLELHLSHHQDTIRTIDETCKCILHIQAKSKSIYSSVLTRGFNLHSWKSGITLLVKHTLLFVYLRSSFFGFLWTSLNITLLNHKGWAHGKEPCLLASPAPDLKLCPTPVCQDWFYSSLYMTSRSACILNHYWRFCYEMLEVSVCENDWLSEKLLCSFAHRQRSRVSSSTKL